MQDILQKMKKPKHQQTIRIPKAILYTAKTLETLSPGLATQFAIKLFTTPIRHKLPKREIEMDTHSKQQLLKIESLNKKVMVYQYGASSKKILLVHGWSGRGTQLVKIADELLKLGYSTVSYDAPGHGKAPGKTSNMSEFIAAALQIEKEFGPFEYAIGHSLGGMTVLNAMKRGLNVKKAVIIGSGDVVEDILNDFVLKLKLKSNIAQRMKSNFENRLGETMNSYSAYIAAKEISVPVLVVHDENDDDVPVSAAHHIYKHLEKGQLLITKELGHRKILGDSKVIKKIVEFIS